MALIAGADEFAGGIWQIRHLQDGSQSAVSSDTVAAEIRRMLQMSQAP